MERIYLDHAATTPLCQQAQDAMRSWLSGEFGNPSSLHAEGRRAKEAIDEAREIVSDALGCMFGEVTFTSSGTEAANMAILGTALSGLNGQRKRILLGAAEHHCVLECRETLELLGFQVDLIPVDRSALIDLDWLASTMSDNVLLVSVMHANNEFGTIQPVHEVAQLAHSCGALVHCDAVQTFGNLNISVADLDVDMLTVSAHKVRGPKGIGAMFLRAGVKIKPLLIGGGQEREMRAGTENVAGIVGFGAAIKAFLADQDRVSRKTAARDEFWSLLESSGIEPLLTVPDRSLILGGHCHLRFPGIQAESMLVRLDRMGLSASSGAACSSGSIMPSHVMLAAGYSEAEAKEGLRFTFGWNTAVEEAMRGAEMVVEAVRGIRAV